METGNIVKGCDGCTQVGENNMCIVYPSPKIQMRWFDDYVKNPSSKVTRIGCAFNIEHIRELHDPNYNLKAKKRVGQQKQKHRRK